MTPLEYAVLTWTKCLRCSERILEVEGAEPLCVQCAHCEAIVAREDCPPTCPICRPPAQSSPGEEKP